MYRKQQQFPLQQQILYLPADDQLDGNLVRERGLSPPQVDNLTPSTSTHDQRNGTPAERSWTAPAASPWLGNGTSPGSSRLSAFRVVALRFASYNAETEIEDVIRWIADDVLPFLPHSQLERKRPVCT